MRAATSMMTARPEIVRAERCEGVCLDLDQKDRLLVKLLRKNARASLVALARDIDLSRSATHDRITRLEENGVIQGYTIRLASEARPATRAFLTVNFETGAAQAALIDTIKALDGVDAVYCLSGDIDSLVYCECDSAAALSELRDELASRAGVTAITTRQILASSLD